MSLSNEAERELGGLRRIPVGAEDVPRREGRRRTEQHLLRSPTIGVGSREACEIEDRRRVASGDAPRLLCVRDLEKNLHQHDPTMDQLVFESRNGIEERVDLA